MASLTYGDLTDRLNSLTISGNSSDSDGNSSDSDTDYGESMDRLFNPNRTIFTFGRFQPPTIGHEGLIKSVENYAIDLQAQPYVFVSLTQNALKDSEWKKAIPKLRNRNELLPSPGIPKNDSTIKLPKNNNGKITTTPVNIGIKAFLNT